MTVLIAVELKKLECEGFGVYIDKNRMENDKIFPPKIALLHLSRRIS